jgi:hypothetical protein
MKWSEASTLADDTGLQALVAQLCTRHRDAVSAVLLYGSCLRSGDLRDGLVDIYLLCDSYRAAYGSGVLAAANWLLPPNVFYTQVATDNGVLRSKVTVISQSDFIAGCSPDWFQSYIWGRFAQPTVLVYCRDPATAVTLEAARTMAATTLLRRALPRLPEAGSVVDLWDAALRLSYATELRAEGSGRSRELVVWGQSYYEPLAAEIAGDPAMALVVSGDTYRSKVPRRARILSRWGWWLRRVQGKLLSVLRLIKALFTFEGGLDYVAWKLERHSGQSVDIPPRVRRYPLIFVWGFFWQLYRRGLFR